eukprot:4537203-Amphidinium_carterae.1
MEPIRPEKVVALGSLKVSSKYLNVMTLVMTWYHALTLGERSFGIQIAYKTFDSKSEVRARMNGNRDFERSPLEPMQLQSFAEMRLKQPD